MTVILILISRMRKVMQKDKIRKLLPLNITHRHESGRLRALVCSCLWRSRWQGQDRGTAGGCVAGRGPCSALEQMTRAWEGRGLLLKQNQLPPGRCEWHKASGRPVNSPDSATHPDVPWKAASEPFVAAQREGKEEIVEGRGERVLHA